MRHPYEKFIRIEFISIVLATLFGFIALIKSYLILTFVCFALIAISIIAEAIILWLTHYKAQAGKQFVRAFIILTLTVFLLFKW